MALVNGLAMFFFLLTRFFIGLSGIIVKVCSGALRFIWIPIKALLYALGFCVGIGLAIGVVVVLVNGGHLHKTGNHPGCENIQTPAQVCMFGGKVVKVWNGR